MRINTSDSADVVPFRTAMRAWSSISLRTFGGPAGQIAVMHRELVEERRWIGEQRFLHALSFCTVLPGPEAQQLAIYLGWLLNGTLGGLVAGVLFVLPGYITLMVLSGVYAQWGASTALTALFAGLGPAVVAIVAQAVLRIARRSLRNSALVAIALVAFVTLFAFDVPFPTVVGGAGIVGWLASRIRPDLFVTKPPPRDEHTTSPLVADDALHGERPSWGRAARIVGLGVIMWSGPTVLAAIVLGRSHAIVDEGVFFSGSAVVTFGGAYAVLSFVAQRAVDVHHWLLPGEMIHGLALAETTPGPLIMVVQFVAFLGAFRNPGTLNPWLAGVVGATLTVWVTFVPCFVFVFLGAPHIEGLRANARLSAAMTGITAAVVGVIANLSIYFSVHTLFGKTTVQSPGPLTFEVPEWTTISPRALFVTVLAFLLVFRWKMSMLRVLTICALVGAGLSLVTGP